ncbi:MAG: hypothetical protein Q4G65_16385, partial [bacterium]|nr:hypothetical protein [bacterium]
RAEGDFWKNAVGRILCDTQNLMVLQYSDPQFSEIRVVAASDVLAQRSVRVYPVLASDGVYRVDGVERTAVDIDRVGVELPIASREGRELVLKRVR